METLAAYEESATTEGRAAAAPRTLALGSARNRSVEVTVWPRTDIESTATLNALTLLLGTVRDLERAHAEREEQLALWPIEELAVEGDQAVVGGRLHELLSFARRIARTSVSVLITGESGTGKEILARAIHGYSARTDKPFIPFNCTAVPREMLESQLFGYRRGAFTGADRDNPGLIRAAKGGTLFLDEIGELSLDLQPKLLRFLESGEISPLGESPLTVDVRIVAATNRNLEQLVQEGRFREDLYYRLNVIRLTIPPLRERRDEIPALVHHFLQRAAAEFSKGRVRVAEETMEHLLLYAWPGNVRQLQNEIRRMIAMADVDTILKPGAVSHDIRRASDETCATKRRPGTCRLAQRQADADNIADRTGDDPRGAAHPPGACGGRGEGPGNLAKGALSQAPASRSVTSSFTSRQSPPGAVPVSWPARSNNSMDDTRTRCDPHLVRIVCRRPSRIR